MSKKVLDFNDNIIGVFDGEYYYDLSGRMILRIDGDEIYTLDIPCTYIGIFEKNEAKTIDGKLIFRIE